MFKDYVVQLLRGVQNITYIQCNYLHTVIAVDNTQIMGNVLDVFKQRTGNSILDSQASERIWGKRYHNRTQCRIRITRNNEIVVGDQKTNRDVKRLG